MKRIFSFFGVALLALFVLTGACSQDPAATVVPAVSFQVLAANRPLLVERLGHALAQDADAKGSTNKADKSSTEPKTPPPPPPPPHLISHRRQVVTEIRMARFRQRKRSDRRSDLER